MVARDGVEPPTRGFSVPCSTYWATEPYIKMAVSTGLEPAISSVTDWHVNHYTTRPIKMVAEEGFEPSTSGLWARRATSCSTPRFKWRRKQDSNPRALSRLSVFKTDPFSRTWVFLRILNCMLFESWWTRQDSNLRPPGYEPEALTNWATGP